MKIIKENSPGILLCLAIALPSWFLGKHFPVIGGPVIAIIAGMSRALNLHPKKYSSGQSFF